jgi:indolepyruvate ferredoxin oxidoreductase, beta subunit
VETALQPALPGVAGLPAGALPPTPAEPLRALARRRMAHYQDSRYAALYDERLARVETAAGSTAEGREAVAEVERWLALWMMFDDIVQVAALKLAESRQARVRSEVKAAPDEIVKVFDHFKPGVPEFAALLPNRLAQRLLAWDRARTARGLDPWALPLKIGTHTVLGAAALRFVAALKGLRRRGSRFALEQQLIERWLAAVERGTKEHWALGHELALCGRLIKGYGSTNERGKANLLHVIDHLAFAQRPAPERAEAVRTARVAALADDAGTALDKALLAHGAPARPVREQTIRWYKRKPVT